MIPLTPILVVAGAAAARSFNHGLDGYGLPGIPVHFILESDICLASQTRSMVEIN